MAKRTKVLLYVSCIAILVSAHGMRGLECGMKMWTKVRLAYISDYTDHPASTESRVISIKKIHDSVQIGVVGRLQRLGSPDESLTAISTDNGHTWQRITKRLPSNLTQSMSDFLQAPSNPNRLYKRVGTNGIFMTSADGGRTWNSPKLIIEGASGEPSNDYSGNRGQLSVYINAIHPLHSETVFASFKVGGLRASQTKPSASLQGIYVSHDAGDHWVRFTLSTVSFPYAEPGASPLGIDPHHEDVLYALGKNGILKSADGGKTWGEVGQSDELVASPLMEVSRSGKSRLGAPDSTAVFQFEFDHNKPGVLYMVTSKGAFKTVDEGRTWYMLDLGFYEVDAINSIAVDPRDSSTIFVGTRYGIYRSTDSGCSFKKVFPNRN